MVGQADEVEACVVSDAGMLEDLADLVDVGFQTEAEEDFVVGGHDAAPPSGFRCHPTASGGAEAVRRAMSMRSS